VTITEASCATVSDCNVSIDEADLAWTHSIATKNSPRELQLSC